MPDDQKPLEQLITDLLGRAMEHVMAVPADDWVQVLQAWDEFTATEVDAIIGTFDEKELRSLAAQLLRYLTALQRTELLGEAFPTLRISEN